MNWAHTRTITGVYTQSEKSNLAVQTCFFEEQVCIEVYSDTDVRLSVQRRPIYASVVFSQSDADGSLLSCVFFSKRCTSYIYWTHIHMRILNTIWSRALVSSAKQQFTSPTKISTKYIWLPLSALPVRVTLLCAPLTHWEEFVGIFSLTFSTCFFKCVDSICTSDSDTCATSTHSCTPVSMWFYRLILCSYFRSSAATAPGRGLPGAQVECVHVPATATQDDDNATHASLVRFRRAHELGTTQVDQRVSWSVGFGREV